MTFGNKLRSLRENTRKSQARVALEIGQLYPDEQSISQTYLSALEQRPDAPSGKILNILSAYYDVDVTYFFSGDENDQSGDVFMTREEYRLLKLWRENKLDRILNMIAKKIKVDAQ